MADDGLGPSWLDQNREFREVQLAKSILDGDNVIKVVRLREPVVRDLEKLPAQAYEQPVSLLRHVLESCSGLSGTAIRLLTIPDLTACTRALTEMGFSLETAYGLFGQQKSSPPETGQTGSGS